MWFEYWNKNEWNKKEDFWYIGANNIPKYAFLEKLVRV